jgi:intein-encoded DNA endonuclease-like protein
LNLISSNFYKWAIVKQHVRIFLEEIERLYKEESISFVDYQNFEINPPKFFKNNNDTLASTSEIIEYHRNGLKNIDDSADYNNRLSKFL